jgi:hypothetical protein
MGELKIESTEGVLACVENKRVRLKRILPSPSRTVLPFSRLDPRQPVKDVGFPGRE